MSSPPKAICQPGYNIDVSYDLAQLILAKGLGEASVVLAEVSSLALAAVSSKIIKPQAPWHYAVVHRMSLGIPIPQEAGVPKPRAASQATALTTYVTMLTWNVVSGVNASLREISLDSDNFPKTKFRVTIGGITYFGDVILRSALTIPFPKNNMPPGTVVNLDVASTDGTSVTAYGSMGGVEWPDYIFSLTLRKQGGVTQHTMRSSSDLILQGFPMWAYISDTDPFYLDITNSNGMGGESFLARFEVINTDETRMNEIIRITRQMGLPEAVQMVTPIPDPARLARAFARQG